MAAGAALVVALVLSMGGTAWADTGEDPAPAETAAPDPDPSQLVQPPSEDPSTDPAPGVEGDFSDDPDTQPARDLTPAPEQTGSAAAPSWDAQQIEADGQVVDRGEYDQTYQGPDGTKVTKLSLTPLNVQDDGQWVPIQTDAHRTGVWSWLGAGGAAVDHHPLTPEFAETASDQGLLKLSNEDRQIAFTLVGAAGSKIDLSSTDSSHIEYPGVFPDTDLVYDVQTDGVKENFRVHTAPGASGRVSWQWRVDAGGLTLKKDKDGNVAFLNSDGSVVFVMPTPIMTDSAGDDSKADASTSLSTAVMRQGDSWIVNFAADRAWMNDPARVYPVKVDPTVNPDNEDMWAYKSDGLTNHDAGVWAGNSNNGGYWRTVMHYNYEQLFGKQVLDVIYGMGNWQQGRHDPEAFWLYHATQFGFDSLGPELLGPAFYGDADSSYKDDRLSDQIAAWVRDQVPGSYFTLRGDEVDGQFTMKQFYTAMLILWKDYPDPGSIASPANGDTNVSLTPTLTPQGASTGQPSNAGFPDAQLQYHYKLSTTGDIAADPDPVWDTGWVTDSSAPVPVAKLQPGTQYCWYYQVRDSYDGYRGQSTVRDGPAACFTTNDVPITSLATATPGDKSIVTTLTPTLGVAAAPNPNNRTLSYRYRVVSGGDAKSGAIVSSGWLTGSAATSWTVPANYLQDGVSYTWTVITKDQYTESQVAWVGHFTVNQRISNPGPAPTDTAGPVTVNLANGNAGLSFTSPTVSTLGGQIGMSFQYNSLKPLNTGLKGEYYDATDSPNQIPLDFGTRPVVMTRTDPAIDFNWGDASPSSATSGLTATDLVPKDFFLARWSGFITLPAGTYYFGATGDNGYRAWIGSTQILNHWVDDVSTSWASAFTVPSGGKTYPFSFEYFERQGAANIRFMTKASASADDSTAVSVPAAWFSRTPSVLPAGWSGSSVMAGDSSTYVRAEITEGAVNLIDGTGTTHAYGKTSSGGYTPPAGEKGVVALSSDGLITLTAEDGTVYTFNKDGSLGSATAPASLKRPAAPVVLYRPGTTLIDSVADPLSVVDANANPKTYDRAVVYRYSGDSQCVVDSGFTAAPTGMLCKIEYPDGSFTKLLYNSSGRLVRLVNPGSEVITFAYDSKGRLTQAWNGLVNDWIMAKTSSRSATTINATTIAYDATTGKAVSVTLPAPDGVTAAQQPKKTYTYNTGATYVDATGLTVPAGTGSDGHAVKAVFNSLLQATSVVTAEGLNSQTEWNGKDQKLSTLSPQGQKSTSLYDSQDRPTDTYGPAPASCFTSDRTPASSCPVTPAHSSTKYDEGMNGLDVQYWDNGSMTGAPKAETLGLPGVTDGYFRKDFSSDPPLPAISGTPWTIRGTGLITFPETGQYKFNIYVDDAVRLYIDDVLVIDNWTVHGWMWAGDWKTVNATAGQQSRIRIEYENMQGVAAVSLNWWRPGQATWEETPGQYLTPNYGLATSSTTDDSAPTGVAGVTAGQVSALTTATSYGDNPWLGLAQSTTVDPGGLALTSRTTYESSQLYNRLTGTLSPADNGQTTSSNGTLNTYWPDAGTPSAATCGVPATQKQYGMLQSTRTAPGTTETGLADITTQYVYDVMGRPAGSKKTGDTAWSCVTYDTRGRVASSTAVGLTGAATRTITNTFKSATGDPLTTTTQDDQTTGSTTGGKITTVSDLLGRTVSVTDVWGTVTTTSYNILGQATTVTTKAGTNTYTLTSTYSLDGRLETESDGGKVIADPTYSNGQVTSISYPAASTTAAGNGTTLQYSRDSEGRDTSLTLHFAGDTTTVGDSVVRSQSGRIIRDEISDSHAAGLYPSLYSFDTTGRLTTATIPGHTLAYGYSATNTCGSATAGANGNRTSMTDTPTGAGALQYSQQYCYDKADRLLTEDETITGNTATNTALTRPEKDLGAGAITYDAHGNITTLADQTFTYDASDRHTKTTLTDGTVISYTRDVTGSIIARTETKTGTNTMTTRYSGPLVLDGSNAVIQRNLSLPGGVSVSVPTGGQAAWAYPNMHGDVTWTATAAGARTGLYLYDPFGQPMDLTTKVIGSPSSDEAVPDLQPGNYDQGWVGSKGKGYEHAGTIATIEMGVRMYAAWLGRFLAADPVAGGNTSRYNYPNDPINKLDLDGRMSPDTWEHRQALGQSATQDMLGINPGGGPQPRGVPTPVSGKGRQIPAIELTPDEASKKDWAAVSTDLAWISAYFTTVGTIAELAAPYTGPAAPFLYGAGVSTSYFGTFTGIASTTIGCVQNNYDGPCQGQLLTLGMALALNWTPGGGIFSSITGWAWAIQSGPPIIPELIPGGMAEVPLW